MRSATDSWKKTLATTWLLEFKNVPNKVMDVLTLQEAAELLWLEVVPTPAYIDAWPNWPNARTSGRMRNALMIRLHEEDRYCRSFGNPQRVIYVDKGGSKLPSPQHAVLRMLKAFQTDLRIR